jgi:glucose uptake protein GlcU
MEIGYILLFTLIAVMMIASTSIGIQCLNDPKTKREQYLIITLILSILTVIGMGIILYQNMSTPNLGTS